MVSNRRSKKRNRFEFKRNYIIPLVCIIITCVTIISCTIITTNIKNSVYASYKNEKSNDTSSIDNQKQLTSNQIVEINSLISFLFSNLDFGQSLNDSLSKYYLTCKYYNIDNTYSIIPDTYINSISPEIYRELGYVYFDNYKDEYKYIKESDFEKTFAMLFSENLLSKSEYSKYYISDIKGYLMPKNLDSKNNIAYKLDKIESKEDNKYIAKFVEVNMYKLYEQKNLEEINEYISSDKIDYNFTTGNILNVFLEEKYDKLVFSNYSI